MNTISKLKNNKGEQFCKIADGVLALILCIPSDVASYLKTMKVSLTVQSFRTDKRFILNIS